MGHKSKKLVQKNKAHKDRSKPIGKKTKTTPKLNKKQTKIASKELRISQAKQRRDRTVKLNAESDYNLRGKNNSAPLLCGIFPLFEFHDTEVVFSLLKSTDPNAEIERIADIDNYRTLNTENFLMKSKKFKRNFSFVCCRNYRDRFDYLDLAKIVDWCLFILPDDLDELVGDYCEDLFASLFAQGLPSSCFLTLRNRDQFKLKDESKYFESITKIVLNDERIQCLSDANDAGKLMNYLANNCKPSYAASKKSLVDMKSIGKKRGYFLMRNLYFDEERNQLSVTGCMRGFGVDLDRTKYVHLTGIGDFPIKEARWISPEESNRFNDTSEKNMKQVVIDHSATEKKSDLLLDGTDNNDKEDLEDDEEDLENEEEDSESEEESDEEGMEMDQDEDEEEMVEDISDVDSDLDPADEKMSFATTAHSGYSTAQIQKFKESRENSMFPDEVEVAYWEKARDKFKKYRGLESFKRSEWPLTENLPNYYVQLHQFRKYQHDRNRLCNSLNRLQREQIANFIRAGSKFEMVLEKFSTNDYEKIDRILKDYPARHLIGSNLFTFEHRVGMFHFNERRIATVDNSVIDTLAKLEPNFDSAIELGEEANSHLEKIDPNLVLKPMEEPIKSKESMLFQVGFRRFSATPIYSEFTANSSEPGNKGKSKFLKFMPLHQAVVATGYGPVTYGPTPVLQFRIRQIDLEGAMDGEMSDPFVAELVATGSLLSIDTSRPIIKRVLLTGQIYKVHKRSVMIRYMFFNTEDIEHFKEIPLHTKSNKVGKIVRCHGTHGYMRCHFNKAVTQDEIPCMPLYKRVYPKYTVEKMYDYLPDKDHIDGENEAAWDPMDQLF